MLKALSAVIQRYLLVWLVAISAVAWMWPDWFPPPDTSAASGAESSGGFADPFIATKPQLSWLISLTMFCIGCLLTAGEINEVFRRWPSVLGGTAIQYTSMPLLAWSFGLLLDLPRDYLIGVTMVGCVPGAMASNVLTLAARGNVSYSVSLTTSATILSPLVVPFVLLLTLGSRFPIEPVDTGIKLLKEVVGPVVIGHLLCRRWSSLASLFQPLAPIVANATIIWVIAVVVALNRELLGLAFTGQAEGSVVMLVALLAINLLGYVAGWQGGRLLKLDDAKRRALTLEIGMQNAGLGTILVLDQFKDLPAAAIPTAVYTFGCMLTGTLLAQWWSRSVPAEATKSEL